MKRQETRKKRRTVIVTGLLFLWVVCSAAGCRIEYGMYPGSFVMTPHELPNTKWTCQERELYFISDKHGECRGEAVVAGEHFFIGAAVDGTGYTDMWTIDAASLEGIGNVKKTSGFVSKTILHGYSKYMRDRFFTESSEKYDGMLSPKGESLTLHFLREDLEDEIDFNGPDCRLCRDMRVNPQFYIDPCADLKEMLWNRPLDWEERLTAMLGPDGAGAA